MNDDRFDKINDNNEPGSAVQADEVQNDTAQNNEPVSTDQGMELNTSEPFERELTEAEKSNGLNSDENLQSPVENIESDNTVSSGVNINTANGTDRAGETQRIWEMQNFRQDTNNPGPGVPNYNNFYRESYKKTSKKSDVWKYVLVSIVSSLLGGIFIAVLLLVVAPAIQPQIKGFVGEIFPGVKQDSSQPGTGELKRVEIVQTGESAVTSVAEKVGPSVVGIKTSYQNSNALFGIQPEGGEGSGIIISSDGYILTNHHVIENAVNDKTRGVQNGAKIQVYLPNKIDKPYTATVKGYDSKTDLAVLKIEADNLPAIEFGDSDQLKIGEPAIAIGNPGGLEYMGSVTQGVVSGLNRTVQLDGGRKIKLVQTDAAINPGNSGGALVNIKGQLIGVNTIKMVATGFEGLGFAIPVNDAKRIAQELMTKTYISKPYLGITVDQRYTEQIAKANNMPVGVYVADVEILGAAEKSGIKAGDVITKFNTKAITSFNDLEDEKNKFKPGDIVKVEIFREGVTKKLEVKLGETK